MNKDKRQNGTAPLCSYCGSPLDEEEAANPRRDEDGDILCDECYQEHYEYECPQCCNPVENETNKKHIFITPALAEDQGLQTGIYSVLSWPWAVSNYFSFQIIPSAIKRVADLPDELKDELEGNYLCEECVEKIKKEITRT